MLSLKTLKYVHRRRAEQDTDRSMKRNGNEGTNKNEKSNKKRAKMNVTPQGEQMLSRLLVGKIHLLTNYSTNPWVV